MEFTGAEEVSHVPNGEAETEAPPNRGYVHKDGNGNGNGKAKAPANGLATQAQVRALHALSRKAQYHEDDITNLIAPFEVSRFEDLPKEAASQLIGYMQQGSGSVAHARKSKEEMEETANGGTGYVRPVPHERRRPS